MGPLRTVLGKHHSSSIPGRLPSVSHPPGCPLLLRPQEGCTPLLLASERGHVEAVARLIDARAEVNVTDNVSLHSHENMTPTDAEWRNYAVYARA